MLRNHDKEVFLATTALEEFWDTTKPMVFLGQWCLLYGRKSSWQGLGGELVQGPFEGDGAVREAYAYVNEVYERALPALASALNGLHGKQYSVRYWRIVAGPWLHVFVSVAYERYRSLRAALDQYPRLQTLALAEEAHVVAADTHDFASYLREDTFNLQIYSKILTALGLRFPARGADLMQRATYVKAGGLSWKQKAVRLASGVYARTAAKLLPSLLLKDSYFPKPALAALAASNPGRILPSWGSLRHFATWPLRPALRDRLRGISFGDSEFERCLAIMLPGDIPKCFVEGYAEIFAAARSDYPARISAVFSANAWYYDEIFKQWAAGSAEQGAVLLGCQHGGNYGALAFMPSEDHETSIVDRYYSWGWDRAGRPAAVTPMPASKLIGRERRPRVQGRHGVLWVATSMPRYLVQFPWLPGEFENYLGWQRRFVTALDAASFREVRLRPHREDNGWDVTKRLRHEFPTLQIESWDVSFQDSLDNCELYVCDHLSTTFIEALAANTPTVLFWDFRANELRPEASAYYDLLLKNGILFDRPENAASAVNVILADVDGWWNEPERQKAVTTFCKRFASVSANAIDSWQSELKLSLAPRKPDV
jgi:putative transferase (TIGR04331 family)